METYQTVVLVYNKNFAGPDYNGMFGFVPVL